MIDVAVRGLFGWVEMGEKLMRAWKQNVGVYEVAYSVTLEVCW